MGNLTEELESGRIINCSGLEHNKNQDYVRNLFISKFSEKDFVIFHLNIRGLNNNKLNELSVFLSANPPHIVCLTEYHLGVNEIDKILLANYSLGAKFCRNTFRNRGVSIFTHESIQFTNTNLNKFCKEKDLEIWAVKLRPPSCEICIITIYRSPSGGFRYFIANLEKILKMIYSNSIEIIICGDININDLIDSTHKQLLDSLLISYGLCGTVQFPTIIQNNSQSAIDNIFINTFKFGNFSLYPITNRLSENDNQIIIIRNIFEQNRNTYFYFIKKLTNFQLLILIPN
jgi:exonuclease III